MRHLLFAITAVLSAGCLWCGAAWAQEANRAKVTVVVKNATADGADVEGDGVTLRIFQQNQEIKRLEGKVDAEGKAVFENVPGGAGFVALGQARHSGMSFGAEMFELKGDQGEFTAEIEVYEVSRDNSKLEVGTHHFVVKPSGDSIVVTEYMQLRNPTDRAITSAQKDEQGRNKVVEIFLPAGFKNLTMGDYFQESAIVVTKEGFYDIMASPPGEHNTSFSYALDITGDVVEVTRKISMPTAEFIVFSQLGAGNLHGLEVKPQEMTFTDGSPAEYFRLSSQAKGTELKLELRGFSVAKPQTRNLIILSAVFGAMGVLAAKRAFLKKA